MSQGFFASRRVLWMFILLCLLPPAVAAAQTQKFTRPTVIAVGLAEAPIYHVKMAFEDEDFFFAYRFAGRGAFIPGFFVYEKKQNKWLEIKRLSTEQAKFGYYFPFITEGKPDTVTGAVKLVRNPALPLLAITWDYRNLKNVLYVDVPLETGGSISFPDKIIYNKTARAYELSFNSAYNIEEMSTRFWVLKRDLKRAFK